MSYSSHLRAYRKADLETAPKTDILDRLFGRLETDLLQAVSALAARDVPRRAAALDHAYRILTELNAALDHKAAPELCANLAGLYAFCNRCIAKAAVDRDPAPLQQVVQVVRTLRESFAEAVQALK
jgi:flagellar secretion chaperone FliS